MKPLSAAIEATMLYYNFENFFKTLNLCTEPDYPSCRATLLNSHATHSV